MQYRECKLPDERTISFRPRKAQDSHARDAFVSKGDHSTLLSHVMCQTRL